MNLRLPCALLALVAASACVPAALKGDFAPLTPEEVASGIAPPASQHVRWGGTILSMENKPDRSCFEVLARPLDVDASPQGGDRSLGRFLACVPGYRDPALFKPGRDITVVGTVSGRERHKVGDFDYQYATVAAQDVVLWSEAPPPAYVYDPFFYPYLYYPAFAYYYPVIYAAPGPRPFPPPPLMWRPGPPPYAHPGGPHRR